MIEFEGFELVSPEQAILDKESRVRPQVIDMLMKSFGAKKGSSTTKTHDLISADQKVGLGKAITGLGQTTYTDPGAYQGPGKSADDLDAYRATDVRSLGKLQDERRLSIQGVEQLRNQQAQSAMQVRPDIAALRNVASEATMPYQARLNQTVREATKALGQAEIADVRGRAGTGALYGSARELAKTHMGQDYARTVGEAAARAVEESNLQRMQLGIQGAQAAGQLGMTMQQQRAQAAGQMGQLEVQGLGLTQQDLAARRGIAEQSKQYGAGYGLQQAGLSFQEAQAQNLFNQQTAQQRNQYRLDRLKSLGDLSSRNTVENIVHKKPGSAGLLPGLISAGATIAGGMMGGPAGAQMGAQLGGAVAGGLSQEYTGDGSFQGQGLAQMGAGIYGAMQAPGGGPANAAQLGERPMASGDYAWYQDDPNEGWFDRWRMGGAQQQNLARNEALLARQNWDNAFAARQQYVTDQLRTGQAFSPSLYNYMRSSGYSGEMD